jgi:hypothetical protein
MRVDGTRSFACTGCEKCDQTAVERRSLGGMNADDGATSGSPGDEIERYFAAHPRSPAAVRQPRLYQRDKLWVALLGPNLQEGISGLGPTVEAALRAFDSQYQRVLRPPGESAHRMTKNRKAA